MRNRKIRWPGSRRCGRGAEKLNSAQESFGTPNPDAFAFALETGSVGVVGQGCLQLGAGEVGLLFGDVELGELNAGAGVAVVFQHLFPRANRALDVAERSQGFGVGHQ